MEWRSAPLTPAIAIVTVFLGTAIAPVYAETIATSQTVGVAAPACESQTQLALNQCAARWEQTADYMRSLLYEEQYRQLDSTQQDQFITIEQTWNRFRDAHCQELNAHFQSGSVYPLLRHSCRATLSNDRMADLQRLGTSAVDPSTLDTVTPLLNEVDFQTSDGQQLWTEYQQLHCQLEAALILEEQPFRFPSDLIEQCTARLDAERFRQLEPFARTRE